MHNSLVGQTTNAWGYLSASETNCNKGKPKAAVLPVPVCASPIKSFVPLNKTGIAFSWICVGVSNPNALIEASKCSFNPKSSKLAIIKICAKVIDLQDEINRNSVNDKR